MSLGNIKKKSYFNYNLDNLLRKDVNKLISFFKISKKAVFLCGLSLMFCILLIKFLDFSAYEVHLNGNCIAYVKDINSVKEVYENVTQDSFKNGEVSGNNEIQYKFVLADKSALSDEKLIKANILNSINLKNKGIKLITNNKDIALLKDSNQVDELIKNIKNYYINKNHIDTSKIVSVKTKDNIYYEEVYMDKAEFDDINKICKYIIDEDEKSKKPLINVEITYREKVKETIPAETNIIMSDELYKGETKLKQEGKNGEKEILREIKINNSDVVENKKLGEATICAAKNKIIIKGSKENNNSLAFLYMPTRGAITCQYGSRWGGEIHHGIDIAGNIGDPIKAAAEGVVNKIGWDNVYGNFVKIDHGKGMETLYGHCSKIIVKEGEKINKNQTIGNVGNTGRSTGPHLHFEVRINGIAQNPMSYIK